jgi:putative flippase GtrA
LSSDRRSSNARRFLTGGSQRFRQLDRFRQLIHEGAKFGVVGGIGVIIVWAGADALRFDAGLDKFAAVTVATFAATIFAFLGNRYWSFRHRQGAGARAEGVTFFALNGVGLLIQYAWIALISVVLGLSDRLWYSVALGLGIGSGTLFRFWSYRKWVWLTPETYLARLRRGRHRKGRTTPVPPPATAVAPAVAPAAAPIPITTDERQKRPRPGVNGLDHSPAMNHDVGLPGMTVPGANSDPARQRLDTLP